MMSLNSKNGKEFLFQTDGVDYLKICVDITLFFVGPLSAHSEGLQDFYDQALSILKPDIVQYETGNMSRPKKINSQAFDILPLWVANPKARQDMMQLRLDNSTGPDSAADRAFQFIYFEFDKAGAVRLVLSAGFVKPSAKPLADLAQRLPRKLKFTSGLGGYSLNWNKNGELADEAQKAVYVISQRYLGVDIPDLDGDVEVISQGIKCANWLTFLGDEYVDRLGGTDSLRKTLSNEIILHRLRNGIVMQAGDKPELGDVNRRVRLPLYREVGRIVAPVRVKEHMLFIPSPQDDDQATSKWLARFDS